MKKFDIPKIRSDWNLPKSTEAKSKWDFIFKCNDWWIDRIAMVIALSLKIAFLFCVNFSPLLFLIGVIGLPMMAGQPVPTLLGFTFPAIKIFAKSDWWLIDIFLTYCLSAWLCWSGFKFVFSFTKYFFDEEAVYFGGEKVS
jgi:hypothetical protein